MNAYEAMKIKPIYIYIYPFNLNNNKITIFQMLNLHLNI